MAVVFSHSDAGQPCALAPEAHVELELPGRQRERERARTDSAQLDRAERQALQRAQGGGPFAGTLLELGPVRESAVEAEGGLLPAGPVKGADAPTLQAELEDLLERLDLLHDRAFVDLCDELGGRASGGEDGLRLREGDLARLAAYCDASDTFGVTTSPRTKADSCAVAFVLGFVSHASSPISARSSCSSPPVSTAQWMPHSFGAFSS